MRAWVAVLALVVVVAPGATARANSRFPNANHVVFDETDSNVIVARTTFGVVQSRDGGASWQLVCETALRLSGDADPSVVVAPDGSMLLAAGEGLERSTDDGCSWPLADRLVTGTWVADLVVHRGSMRVFALTSDFGLPNELYASDDSGASWTQLGASFDGPFFETVEVAPSDPTRIYLTGWTPPPPIGMPAPHDLYRSTDSGAHFTTVTLPVEENDYGFYVAGVSPIDPDRILMRVNNGMMDRLIVSDDAGTSWHEVLRLYFMPGFAQSDDGAHVWVGGPEGLWASEDRGETFTRVADLQVQCLAMRGAELWACGTTLHDGFELGRSGDGGRTFDPVLTFERISGDVVCPAGSPTPTACAGMFPTIQATFPPTPTDAGTTTDAGSSDGAMDAGTARAPPPDDDGCTVGRERSRPGVRGLVIAGLLFALALRRRRASR